ncbi:MULTISPECIES: GspE/PulE family protein [unclassified Pseudomonas]|uniref:GspE/PulE family protein n=1 Tax=unclassified Pseudomonas TaxID=196821 RepID=UPI00075E899E|nr:MULTISPECIES: GspE/PulE family protein [unclassified Pseudomonas]KVV07580.1 Type II traffic warden ATPase [Pseudomonas sp. TAD18]KVV08603.1 Type II traffic warden ATPase [Pseudomonas sp. TAA207]
MQTTCTPDRPLDLEPLLPGLLAHGLITPTHADQALKRYRAAPNNGVHPLIFLAAQQFADLSRPGKTLTLETLTAWLARHYGQPYVRIDPLNIDVASVTGLMSFAFAQRHQILVIAADRDAITIASAQPDVGSWEADLRQVLKRPIKRVIANPLEIARLGSELYKLAKSVTGATLNDQKTYKALPLKPSPDTESNSQEHDANDAHIVNIVDWLFQYAFEQRASDIHIEPRREQGGVRFRIDGVLHNVYHFPAQVTTAIVSRLKSLGRMNVAEKRKPQDGRINTQTPTGTDVELRLATLPTVFGEKIVLRIFDPQVVLKRFDQLGFSVQDMQRWQHMTAQPSGIILITGPTGSGKTSTLYATLKQLATPGVNLCTLEDPIEMIEPAFNQMQVQPGIDLTFASGVRALLRQDPDIIMLGEIRDLETAEMAIQAALTGHLVLSTLHTNDAPSAISRLQELGIAPYLIKATLLGVMAQRLVRTLCAECKTPQPLSLSDWQHFAPTCPAPLSLYRARGCAHCRQTGYSGRGGIYEIMLMSEKLKALITPDTDLNQLRRIACDEGMRHLRLAGAYQVAAGTTTLEEAFRVTPHV